MLFFFPINLFIFYALRLVQASYEYNSTTRKYAVLDEQQALDLAERVAVLCCQTCKKETTNPPC